MTVREIHHIIISKLYGALIFFAAGGLLGMASSPAPGGGAHRLGHTTDPGIIPGAWQTDAYLFMLEGKRVALVGNHTSTIGGIHLVDTLLASGIDLIKVFSPEHGFRGEAAAGELVETRKDPETGIPLHSLYGRYRRPTESQLADVDILLFDIQDVGARFYTYISTMTYVMEAAAQYGIPMIILDRPNPNGHYVDGPVLDADYSSFVGLHPVPVVHGMTVGEYARMINGEGWLNSNNQCELHVVRVQNYTRQSHYALPVPPSPNLPNMHAVHLYPSLCFFEGTQISVGRGTSKPFQVYGHPDLPPGTYNDRFVPERVRAAPDPPQLGEVCYGVDLSDKPLSELRTKQQINLQYLIDAYNDYPDKENFFNNFFDNLAGNALLRYQIKAGYSAQEIRNTWQDELDAFKSIRSGYLLYPDNE